MRESSPKMPISSSNINNSKNSQINTSKQKAQGITTLLSTSNKQGNFLKQYYQGKEIIGLNCINGNNTNSKNLNKSALNQMAGGIVDRRAQSGNSSKLAKEILNRSDINSSSRLEENISLKPDSKAKIQLQMMQQQQQQQQFNNNNNNYLYNQNNNNSFLKQINRRSMSPTTRTDNPIPSFQNFHQNAPQNINQMINQLSVSNITSN